jgi:hypothetical protein
MKKIATALLCAAVFLLTSGIAIAQGHGKGKPASTGVQHAASTANTQGVSHGIENAETKQAAHKNANKRNQGKHKKHKRGKKHHTATTAH